MENINIKIEENEEVPSGTKQNNQNWQNVSYYLLLSLVFLLPFWILPFKGNMLGMNKLFLVFVLVLLAAIFYLIHILQQGCVNYPRSLAFFGLGGVLLVGLISSFFSGSFIVSFFGTGAEIAALFPLFIIFLTIFLTANLFQSEKKILTFLSLLMLSSIIVFIGQVLHSVFGFNFGDLIIGKTNALLGSWNELAIFFGLISLLSIIFLEFFEAKRSWRLLLYGTTVLSLLAMVIVNSLSAWIVFGVFILILFVYLFSSFKEFRNFARLPLFILLITLFFILARPLVGDLVDSLGLNSIEVRPSWTATFEVTKETWKEGVKNVIIGSGPNTFVYDWAKFKPLSINQTLFWSVRFQNGIGFLPTFFATTGVLGVLAWLFFLAIILYYGFRVINYSGNSVTKTLLFGTFLGSVYLWVFNIIYSPSIFLFTLSLLMSGLFLAALIRSGNLKSKDFSFVQKRGSVSFISSLVIVLLLIVSVSLFYLLFQKYWATHSYVKGLDAFNIEGNVEKSENYFLKAVRFDEQSRYYRTLSELGLVKLSRILTQNLPVEEARLQFQNNLAFVIEHGQNATRVNPLDSLNWMNLGGIYENIIPFKIDGAREVALDAYNTALEKSPTDPQPLLASARVEIASGNNDKAKVFLQSSLKIKSNYTSALFLLAQIAAEEGNIEDAIKQATLAQLTAPNDVGILFQLGLLYYQNKDYQNAGLVLERAVSLSPNYSNARYFLGLSYDQLGQKQAAIEQFEKIEVLNKGNNEVKNILSNLRAGRSALSSISPPKPAPEERGEPPIEEELSVEELPEELP